jgi:hypothetical protein
MIKCPSIEKKKSNVNEESILNESNKKWNSKINF